MGSPLDFTCFVGASTFAAGWLGHAASLWWRQRHGMGAAAGSVLHQSLCQHLYGTSTGPYVTMSSAMAEERLWQ